jgi:hypothetical protein
MLMLQVQSREVQHPSLALESVVADASGATPGATLILPVHLNVLMPMLQVRHQELH